MERRTPMNPFDSQAFREEFEKTLDRKLEPMNQLLAKHDELIEQHGKDITRARGALKILALLWTGLTYLGGKLLFYKHS